MEGDMLKGKFTRKDNNKVLTTTRALVGGELVQVSRSRSSIICNMLICFSSINVSITQHTPHSLSLSPHRLTTMREWMLRGFSRSSNLESEVHILFLYRWHSIDLRFAFSIKRILMGLYFFIPQKCCSFEFWERKSWAQANWGRTYVTMSVQCALP